jgi:membrane protease YdiL (CAAX protease family)
MNIDTAPAFERGAWSGRGALFLFIVAQAVFIVVGWIVLAYLIEPGWWSKLVHEIAMRQFLGWHVAVVSPAVLFASVLARTIAVLALIFWLRRWLSRSASPSSFGLLTPGSQLLLTGVGFGVLLFVVDIVVVIAQTKVFGPHASASLASLATHHGTDAFLLDLSSGALITPIAEEIVFRGLVFTALVQRTPVWVAVTLSSLLFSGFHFDQYSFIPIFAVGAGLALLYYRTRNLWASITAHGTLNLVALWLHFLKHP